MQYSKEHYFEYNRGMIRVVFKSSNMIAPWTSENEMMAEPGLLY